LCSTQLKPAIKDYLATSLMNVNNLNDYPYPSTRRVVMGKQCAVATSQPLATLAGMEMFWAGGNAVDAALATAIALTVVEPTSNGIGSDAFALIWDGKLHGLNASGKSPQNLTLETFCGDGRGAFLGLAACNGSRRCIRLAKFITTLGKTAV
jgi:gamma-glutamyltranspeptidase